MSSKLPIEALRQDVAQSLFPTRGREERFGMEVEVFPFDFTRDPPEPWPLFDTAERRGSIELVEAFAGTRGVESVRPGAAPDARYDDTDGRFTFEPGGQIEFSCAPMGTPSSAYEATARALDGLEVALRAAGVRMISIGANPWQAPGEVPLQTDAPRYVCMDRYFESIGPAGELMMRRTGAAHVNLDFGPPSKARLRWRASQLLSPLALATFAFSPLEGGMHKGYASLRGTAWRDLDASRTGFPASFLRDPLGRPEDHYLDFALDARVMLVRYSDRWVARTQALTFRHWIEYGIDGRQPTLDDWHYHLSTLFPEVRLKGFLELRSADAQARPFRSVPLTWWNALLGDDQNLGAVLERLDGTVPDLRSRWESAAQEGLAHPDLAADAKQLFAWASEAILRAPFGTYSQEMVRAFIAFGERFALRGRTPADELVETFLQRGGFDVAAWDGLVDEWSAVVGLPTAAERGAGEQQSFRP